jgi:hypothetical protein
MLLLLRLDSSQSIALQQPYDYELSSSIMFRISLSQIVIAIAFEDSILIRDIFLEYHSMLFEY